MATEIIFEGNGNTFSARYEAEDWLRKNGYSIGSSCLGYPTYVKKGDFLIGKARNLSRQDINEMDGYLESGREGVAKLFLNKEDNQ